MALIFLLIPMVTPSVGNPFQKRSADVAVEKEQSPPNPIYVKLAIYQQKLRTKLSETMRAVKTTGNYIPLLPLGLIAFLYGILHAAGPGHGKALAASYLISRGRKAYDGFFVGGMIAILHGISAIVLVLFLRFILRKSVMAPVEEITYITKIVSYSLILGIGILITLKNLYGWYRNIGVRRDLYSGKYDSLPTGSLTTALAAGIVPCPGTVLIMLFAVSIDMAIPGILLAAAQTLGMALTISLVGVLVVTGKAQTLSVIDYTRRDIADTIEKTLETLAGIAIITIGALFLMTTLR